MTDDERKDHTPMWAKKHEGKTPSQVAEIDPSYLVWAYETWDRPPCSKLLYEECVRDVAEQRRQRGVSRDQDRG